MKPNGVVSHQIFMALFSLSTEACSQQSHSKITLDLTTVTCPGHEELLVGAKECA